MAPYREIKNLNELEAGDFVKGKISGISYMVVANYGTRVTAIRVADITNASEWEVFKTKRGAEE